VGLAEEEGRWRARKDKECGCKFAVEGRDEKVDGV
jgi:hypothetical protein